MEKSKCGSSSHKSRQANPKKVPANFTTNYLGISFEPLIYNSMFKIYTDNGLISLSHSGFQSGKSCAKQLPSHSRQFI